jgi:hypothetical protein
MYRAAVYWLAGQETVLSSDKADERLAKCYQCPSYSDGQCHECSCFVSVKALLKTERCPLGKWRN